jgi:hypothetical protein
MLCGSSSFVVRRGGRSAPLPATAAIALRHLVSPLLFPASPPPAAPAQHGTGRGDGRDTHAQTRVAAAVHSAWIWVPNRFDVEMMADAVTGDVRYLPGCEEEPQSR